MCIACILLHHYAHIIKIVVIFAVYFRTVVRVLVQFSPKSAELRTGPNWTNTSGSPDRTELDYAARASNWTELDQPPRLARTMVRSGPSRALVASKPRSESRRFAVLAYFVNYKRVLLLYSCGSSLRYIPPRNPAEACLQRQQPRGRLVPRNV